MDILMRVLSEQGLAVFLLVVMLIQLRFFIVEDKAEKEELRKRLGTCESFQKKELINITKTSMEMNGKCLAVIKNCTKQLTANAEVLEKLKGEQ